MTDKIPCTKCGALILPTTAERNNGLCMPCKQGIRHDINKSIEQNKRKREKAKEHDPWRELWYSLVERDCNTPGGYEQFSKNEKIYYAVSTLDGEIINGGFHQYFGNSSGEYYSETLDYLKELGAVNTLDLLIKAKSILFGDLSPPKDQIERNNMMHQFPNDDNAPEPEWSVELAKLDEEYYKDRDNMNERLVNFAINTGLIKQFEKPNSAL